MKFLLLSHYTTNYNMTSFFRFCKLTSDLSIGYNLISTSAHI